MNTAFIYDSPVTGNGFIGRKKDVDLLCNFISGGESVVVYGEPGTGCLSLVQKALSKTRMSIPDLLTVTVDFSRSRTTEDILVAFAGSMVEAGGTSAGEYRSIVRTMLEGTHFVFDERQFEAHGRAVSMNWLPDDIDIMKAFELPARIAEQKHQHMVILIRQFQNILFADENDALLDAMETVVERFKGVFSFIFTGSQFNRLREIFDMRRCFWRSAERFIPSAVDPQQIADYVYRGFQSTGKVLEKDLVVSAAELLRCNMRYVNHLFSIVDSIARGYVNQGVVSDGMRILLSIHSPRFFDAVCSLTDFQLRLLKAVIDGETKFSTAGVIDKYGLNSSANVKRLKDALIKKEMVWFDDNDLPHVQDPLFEYWLRQEYFAG